MIWDLDDLACSADLAVQFGVGRSTVAVWAARYDDFPAPLAPLACGPIYSRVQVTAWVHHKWPGGVPTRGRRRGEPQPRNAHPSE